MNLSIVRIHYPYDGLYRNSLKFFVFFEFFGTFGQLNL